MEILDILNEIKTAKLAIKSSAECIHANRNIADSIKSSCPAAAQTLCELAESNQIRIDLLADFVLDCEDVISGLPEKYRCLLELKYLAGKTWEETAQVMGYSVKYCTKYLLKQSVDYAKVKGLFVPIIKKYAVLFECKALSPRCCPDNHSQTESQDETKPPP